MNKCVSWKMWFSSEKSLNDYVIQNVIQSPKDQFLQCGDTLNLSRSQKASIIKFCFDILYVPWLLNL